MTAFNIIVEETSALFEIHRCLQTVIEGYNDDFASRLYALLPSTFAQSSVEYYTGLFHRSTMLHYEEALELMVLLEGPNTNLPGITGDS
ncbi:hypothetical protein HDU76_001062 [Blyttiomyces sp. JEL0837]|nr:hypothetical protein HDU76_001062 [Blyttiomyces sp. JEL0837]